MTDYTELKRRADELIAANDLFNESPQDNEVGDAWSLANDRFTEAASPEVIQALIAENDALMAACTRAEQVINTESKAVAIATGRANLLQFERDQLKSENDLLGSSRAKLAGELSRLRAKHKDWSAGAAMGGGEQS